MKPYRLILFVLILTQPFLGASQSYKPQRTGWIQVRLPELTPPQHRQKILWYEFDAKTEVFEVYIPPNYDSSKQYGVLAWINPNDTATIPRWFEPLFEEFQLIAVSAAKIGNQQDPARRIGLMECVITQLSKDLNINSRKHFVSGWSGGGRTSGMACFLHPQFWKGAISWVGGSFYKSYPRPMPVGSSSPGINDWNPGAVTNELVKLAKENARFVLITGSRDFNLNDSRGIYRAMKKENFESLLIEEPGLDHNVGSIESMREGLRFLMQQNE